MACSRWGFAGGSDFTDPQGRAIHRMTVARLAVSFDKGLARAVRKAAGKEPTSSWLADAARGKLRAEGISVRSPGGRANTAF